MVRLKDAKDGIYQMAEFHFNSFMVRLKAT